MIRRKTFKSARNAICATWAVNSQRYEFSDILGHTVLISRTTVRSAKNTICDTSALNLGRYEFSQILGPTIVISHKTVRSAKNTIVILRQCTRRDMSFPTF